MAVRKKIPQRMCIGCGEMKDKRDMLRVIKTSDDEIMIDATGKKNGRGAYVCFSPKCLEMAIKNKGLERSLKKSIPEEVYESLRKELEAVGTE